MRLPKLTTLRAQHIGAVFVLPSLKPKTSHNTIVRLDFSNQVSAAFAKST